MSGTPGRPTELLHDWQRNAVDRWWEGDERGPHRGTLEIFTGGGKTLIGLAAYERVLEGSPECKLAVVVPTEALAHQWIEQLTSSLGLERTRVGLMGAGGDDHLRDHQALVAVINSAAKFLPGQARDTQPVMLIVDECHRAGAPEFSRVLATAAEYRLGLSATPQRDDVDGVGEPILYDDSKLGRKLGQIVFRFGLREAREIGWLPDYEIHHHGIALTGDEEAKYGQLTRRIDDITSELRDLGVDTTMATRLVNRGGPVGEAAGRYIGAINSRKDLLYRASERHRVASQLVAGEVGSGRTPRIILFHERVDEANELSRTLDERLPDQSVMLEHSRLPDRARKEALGAFADGRSRVLVSVKSLIEGIDVPDADVGISVASSASVRQRIQSLGRVLRRSFDDETEKRATMHVIYVADTVDELIYRKEDWSDLTGEAVNHYWKWPSSPQERPVRQAGPPTTPRPTEEQEWDRLGREVPDEPVPWHGVIPDVEYSVDTTGTVWNMSGTVMSNPQGVAAMVEAVRGTPGGRFKLTPEHRLVLVFREGEGDPYVAGRLDDSFDPLQEMSGGGELQVAAGDALPGKPDDEGGTFLLTAKGGGAIERRHGRIRELARTDLDDERSGNARLVIEAWRQLGLPGLRFNVSSDGIAWYVQAGTPRFLARVREGFVFPTDIQAVTGGPHG